MLRRENYWTEIRQRLAFIWQIMRVGRPGVEASIVGYPTLRYGGPDYSAGKCRIVMANSSTHAGRIVTSLVQLGFRLRST